MAMPSRYITFTDFHKTNPDAIALPDYTELGVTSVKNIRLDFKDIFVDDIDGQYTKEETHTSAEIEQLRMSFAGGVDIREFPPAVYDRGEEYDRRYVLVYGYGRSEAIRALGMKSWIFTLFTGTIDQMKDVQARENEGYTKRLNKEVDMRKYLSSKVSRGLIKNSEKAINDEFIRIYGKTRDKTCRNRVVKMVMEETGTPQPYIIYTSVPKIQDWIDNHSSVEYKIGGDFNPETDTYGVCVGEGYQYRVVMQSISRYVETGKYTDLIGHMGAPTAKATLESKRVKFVQQLQRLKSELQQCGLTTFPINLIGFLPQSRASENLKELTQTEQCKFSHIEASDYYGQVGRIHSTRQNPWVEAAYLI